MLKRTSKATWKGDGMTGTGTLDTQSGTFVAQPYSFKTRFVSEDGKAGTNPEELIGAAHAGCFAMALSFALTGAGHVPEELEVAATVTLAKAEAGFFIQSVALALEGRVPGITQEKFLELAQSAKAGCPVSKALAAVEISLSAKLL